MTIRPLRRELPYAAFARHLNDEEEREPPAPVDPVRRATETLIGRLDKIEDELAEAQVDMLTLYPTAIRLKLSKLFLLAGERVRDAAHALRMFDLHGTLTPPRAAKPKKKSRFRP